MCDVLHAYLWKLLASPPRLSYPRYAKPILLLTVNATPPCFGEPASETKKKKKQIASYDFARQAESTAAVSKTKSPSTVYFPLLV